MQKSLCLLRTADSVHALCCLVAAFVLCSEGSSFASGQTSADSVSETVVEELTESNWNRLVPHGKEVDAIYGDIVLQNRFVRAVIARPVPTRHANMTVRNVGGCLIDLTTRDYESDQLSAFYPGKKDSQFDSLQLNEKESSVTVISTGTPTKPLHTVTYTLGAEARSLAVMSVWKNTTTAEITLSPGDDIRADGGKEDLQKTANGTAESFWFHDIYWQQACGFTATGYRIRINGNARETALSYESADGQAIRLLPGESFTLNRTVFVRPDLSGVLADIDMAAGRAEQLAAVQLILTSHGKFVKNARISIRRGEESRGTVVTGDHGTADIRIPKGDWEFAVSVAGQQFPVQTLRIDGESGTADLKIDQYLPGTAIIQVTDQDGRRIPSKIEFRGVGDTPTPNWGPETAEFFVRNLSYATSGQVQTTLAAGNYDVIVSHGPEYNAEFTKLTIEHGRTTTLSVQLPRVVSTSGWVSADFHSHSTPSGDNTSSQLGRVLNLAAEQIEFAPCTEHNRISTYDPHIQLLDLQAYMATVSGLELTGSPLPLNHQNVFPLILHPRTQDGGAPVPDASPETQIERIAAWDDNSIKLIQQNHPDVGWLFFDRNADQNPDEGYSRSFGLMNVMEIHPIDTLLNPTRFVFSEGKAVGNQTALNWLQLLNQGYRIYGVVNTDSHYNYHGSGGLRIWIRSGTDDPEKLSSDEMRDSARAGQIVMSNGPYLEASFREVGTTSAEVVSGQDLVAKSGRVSARIRVQCANWLDVDTVMVLVNGRRSPELTFSRDTHPRLFRSDTVRFDETIDLTLTEDAHLIVMTGHRTQKLGDVMGPFWGAQNPAALSNPVFVDLQGDGFTANKDTLDFPLPVRFVDPGKN